MVIGLDLEGKTRREFIGSATGIAALSALPLSAFSGNSISLENIIGKKVTRSQQALFLRVKKLHDQYKKLDDKKKAQLGPRYHAQFNAYLTQLLTKETGIVYNEKNSPDGLIKDWFYIGIPEQRDAAAQKMASLFGGVKETYLDSVSEGVCGSFIQSRGSLGRRERSSSYFVGPSLFDVKSADELFSILDYVYAYARDTEFNIKVNGQNLNFANQRINFYKESIKLASAASTQLINILNGTRNVDDEFKNSRIAFHNKYYSDCQKEIGTLRRELANAERRQQLPSVKIFRESLDTYEGFIGQIDKQLKDLGYEHKPLNGQYVLEKMAKQ